MVLGPSLTQENKDNLERTQKGFAKLVLGSKYQDYSSAHLRLNLVTLSERRTELIAKFAKSSIDNKKLDKLFILKKPNQHMTMRKPEKYRVTKTNTERFRNSSIPFMQRLLNQIENDIEQS